MQACGDYFASEKFLSQIRFYIDLTAEECGLPVGTVKLSVPALTTCEGARYKQQSIQRCREPVCIRGRVSVFVRV